MKLKILMCKFSLYIRCKCPSVSLVIFWSISGPPTTAYHCLEKLNCSDCTWGFCIPFSFSPVRLCSFSTAGRFVTMSETHVASYYQWARMRWTTRTEDATRKRSAVPIDNMEYALLFLTQLVVRLGVSTLIIGNTELSTLSDFS